MENSLRTRTRVKFCGITRPQDALHAASIGVDAIGLVFYDKSPRSVSIEQALEIVRVLPPFITRVGLFVNAEQSVVKYTAEQVGIDLLQFHGNETAEACSGNGRPFIKAIRMRKGLDLQTIFKQYQHASGLLLDSYTKGLYGGTGEQFDWSMIPETRKLPIILAGGLGPDNVDTAIKMVRPYAVDVSGGIESAKGIKDVEKMNAFMRGVSSVS